jgi:exopolysaccharide biosynthesis polyprenyl glycosylphosphotransferase
MTPPPAASTAADTREFPALIARSLGRVKLGSLQSVVGALLRPHAWFRLRFAVDLVIVGLAAGAAMVASPLHVSHPNLFFAAGFVPLVLVMLHARPSPDDRLPGSLLDTALHVLGVVSLATMFALAIDSLTGNSHPIGMALRLWLFAAVYLCLARAVLLSLRRHAVRAPGLATPTLIVGAGIVGSHLVRRLTVDPNYGLRPVGLIDSNPLHHNGNGRSASDPVPVLGTPDDLFDAIEQTGARHVILAFLTEPDHVLVQKVRECHRRGVQVSLVPRLYESINERATLNHVGGMPLVGLRPTNPRGWEFAVKHALDRSVALFALIALAPTMLLIALAVRLSSSGPVLFRQRRVGRDGRAFDLLKFRTMREAKDPDEFELADGIAPGGVEGDDRRTAVGRLLRGASLDELPQFINVLRGEMSLVGPRPERPEFVERFSLEVARYDDRHRVKSGITGWAQVSGLRGQTSIADRVEWDNYYIQNWSLRLDLRILAMTFAEIVRFRG